MFFLRVCSTLKSARLEINYTNTPSNTDSVAYGRNIPKHYCIVFYNCFDVYLNKEEKKK